MTWKLSFISVKKRWQDYVVLLAGLVISVAIFYLFQTMAFNSTFLAEVIPTLADIGIIFQLGTVLLAMITVVYIFYANSFLLSMRKKEYGMYLMLGAKKTKIKQMMAIETLVIGCVSLVIGLVIGMGLAQGMTQSLMARLDVTSELYQAFSPMAMSVTILFFSILFLFTALLNGLKFSRTKLLQLLKEEDVVEIFRPSPITIVLCSPPGPLENVRSYAGDNFHSPNSSIKKLKFLAWSSRLCAITLKTANRNIFSTSRISLVRTFVKANKSS